MRFKQDSAISTGVTKHRRFRTLRNSLLAAAAVLGLSLVAVTPAYASGGFSRTVQPAGCLVPYTVSGSSYASGGGGAAYTQRGDATCIVLDWQNVGAQVQVGGTYGSYSAGQAYAFSSRSGSGGITGYHYYSNEANQVRT